MSGVKIGITEKGDAALDYEWESKLDTVSGTLLITKEITDEFIKKIRRYLNDGYRFIVHCTITGWGGSVIEPNVPPFEQQLQMMRQLSFCGLHKDNLVLRVDPILPTREGIDKARNVLLRAYELGLLPKHRVRISILNETPMIKERFKRAGFESPYGSKYMPDKEAMEFVKESLRDFDLTFELCSEEYFPDDMNFIHIGCISYKTIKRFELPMSQLQPNPNVNAGCTCLDCKEELLSMNEPCPHRCVYCYWARPEDNI